MSDQITHVVDKTGWPDGPWMQEPDRVHWKHAGLDCLIVRVESHGALCGYVGVPDTHPAHGKKYSGPPLENIEVHGGLTYAAHCRGAVCHTPQPGEPDNLYWFGFDAAHAWDITPGMEARLPDHLRGYGHHGDEYRDAAYMTSEVNRLAEQLAAMK